MKCGDVINKLEEMAPGKYAEEWDHVGLQVGSLVRDVNKVLIALDATDAIIDQAVDEGADMIVTHHPMIFDPLRTVTTNDPVGVRVLRMARAGIAYFAMHTNYDTCCMADVSAAMMGLRDAVPLIPCKDEPCMGIGRVGRLPSEMTLRGAALFVKEAYQLDDVRVYGPMHTRVQRAAVLPGSGKSGVPYVLELGAQVYVTGDVDYHMALDLVARGVMVVDTGHYGIEKLFAHHVYEYIRKNIPGVEAVEAMEHAPYEVM